MPHTERQLQNFVIQRIKEGTFLGLLQGADNARKVADFRDADRMPHFSIDEMVHVTTAQSAVRALDTFSTLAILTDDRDISITQDEVLRPDVICRDAESEAFVLFEFKKSSQTGRQALTELLAYEHEIRNVLPFLPIQDITFVLISSEWSTLMDHAAASAAAWSGKSLLCIEAKEEGDGFSLHVRLPQAWYITGSVHLPADALPCYTICLYDYEEKTEQGEIDQRILTAVDMITRDGELSGGHGFVLLWKDYASFSNAPYSLTVCGISPFSLYRAMRKSDILLEDHTDLVLGLDREIASHSPSGHSRSLVRLGMSIKPMLGEICDPMAEGFIDWATYQVGLQTRALPLRCDFWGLPGRYVRGLWLHPAILKHKLDWLRADVRDWRDPSIGLVILNSFFARETFLHGKVSCSDAFRLGVAIGLDIRLRDLVKKSDGDQKEIFKCRLYWLYGELKDLIEEVMTLTNAATNIAPPSDPIEIRLNTSAEVQKAWMRTLEWLGSDFLGGYPLHKDFLWIGVNSCLLFDQSISTMLSADDKDALAELIEPDLRGAIRTLALLIRSGIQSNQISNEHFDARFGAGWECGLSLTSSDEETYSWVEGLRYDDLPDIFIRCLPISDIVFPDVLHKHAPIANINVDWMWVKQGIKEMRQRGEQYPAVHLLASGDITTGPADYPQVAVMSPVENVDEEVMFCDHSNGMLLVVRTSWDDLMAGRTFPNQATGDQ